MQPLAIGQRMQPRAVVARAAARPTDPRPDRRPDPGREPRRGRAVRRDCSRGGQSDAGGGCAVPRIPPGVGWQPAASRRRLPAAGVARDCQTARGALCTRRTARARAAAPELRAGTTPGTCKSSRVPGADSEERRGPAKAK